MAATTTGKAQCITCGKDRSAVRCEGCLQIFCYNHLTDHRQELNKQLDEIEVNRDLFRQTLTQQTTDPKQHSIIKQVDKWEEESIKAIQQMAEESRLLLVQHTTEYITQIEANLNKLTQELRLTRQENDFNEIDLTRFQNKLIELERELEQPPNISIQQDSASLVNKISVVVSSGEELSKKLDQSCEEQYTENELLQNKDVVRRKELNEMNGDQRAYLVLKQSFAQLEKRCVKHQKTEIEVKKQLTVYQSFINDLQDEIQDLTERLSTGSEEYQTLYRKYNALQRSMEINEQPEKKDIIDEPGLNEEASVSLLRNSYENQQNQDNKKTSMRTPSTDLTGEVRQCPMCFWEFPNHLTVDGKREHIGNHFP